MSERTVIMSMPYSIDLYIWEMVREAIDALGVSTPEGTVLVFYAYVFLHEESFSAKTPQILGFQHSEKTPAKLSFRNSLD